MRKFMHFFCLSMISIASICKAHAQAMQDPCRWTYAVKNNSANEYELSFTLNLDKGWHIWAIKVGGDGSQIAPFFSFNANKNIQLVGTIVEKGQLQTALIEGIDGKVNFYANQVRYFQIVKAKAGTIITGTHSYQVCNDKMCMPPKDQNFSFLLQ